MVDDFFHVYCSGSIFCWHRRMLLPDICGHAVGYIVLEVLNLEPQPGRVEVASALYVIVSLASQLDW